LSIAVEIPPFIVACWVIYMFYARLGHILDEVRKLRIEYQFAQNREGKASSGSDSASTPSASVRQVSKSGDARYMPKS